MADDRDEFAPRQTVTLDGRTTTSWICRHCRTSISARSQPPEVAKTLVADLAAWHEPQCADRPSTEGDSE